MGDSISAASYTEDTIKMYKEKIYETNRCHLFVKQYVTLCEMGKSIPLTEKERLKFNSVKSELQTLIYRILFEDHEHANMCDLRQSILGGGGISGIDLSRLDT